MLRAGTGPYRIERRLATGGMAEVFVATRLGPRGFEKRIALKRILPQFAADPDFVEMFTDEARLAAQLDHPNIVHVFDFGQDEEVFFIAMELVSGTNVNQLLRAVAVRDEQVPLDVVLNIGLEAVSALAYAHSFEDEQGRTLSVVHRDVSPANLLLTRNGQIKLSDFGIARAASFERRTQTGELRGKLGYMSPEQVLAMPLDGTSDVFTLATVMAEMLIVEPLFGRPDDLEVLVAIRDGDLSCLHDSPRPIPEDVREVLLQGLTQSRESRPDAAEFYRLLKAIMARRGIAQSTLPAARLLSRLRLVALRRCDSVALEPGDVPANFEDVPPHVSSEAAQEPVREERTVRDLSRGDSCYQVQVDQQVLPDLTFADVAEMWLTGRIQPDTKVAATGDFRPLREFPEFARYVKSAALTWDDSEFAQPTWHGRVEHGRLLPVVYRLLNTRETGALYLAGEGRRRKIFFRDGNIEFIASTEKGDLLGEYLVASGRCARTDVALALAQMARCEGRLTDALIELGVLRSMELFQVVREQNRQRFVTSFGWDQGTWRYLRGATSNEETFGLHLDNFEVLPLAAQHVPSRIVENTLRGMGDRLVRRLPSVAPLAGAYRLPNNWIRLFLGEEASMGVADWLQGAVQDLTVPSGEARCALYFGISCELLQVT